MEKFIELDDGKMLNISYIAFVYPQENSIVLSTGKYWYFSKKEIEKIVNAIKQL